MSSEIAVKVDGVSKCYQIYDRPRDRLLQMLARGKRKYFREFWALKNVSFEIKRGETVGIIGRNGSGKSTLLQMICGTLHPTCGSIRAYGRVAALLELGAGFNSEFTGRENVQLNAAILGVSPSELAEKMTSILDFSELGDFIDQPVKTYSSGMYVRLAFSIAIHIDPQILIVDEALAVGDAKFQAKCIRRIKDIKENGATILFVSHDVGSVRTLCERAIWLDKGCIADQGDVFPVTGRFMEFMFKDEKDSESMLREEIASLQAAELTEALASPMGVTDASEVELMQLSAPGSPLDAPSTPQLAYGLDSRPVTHWGSHKGIIVAAALCDSNGKRIDVLQWGDPFEVVIDVRIPREIPREYLSVAFSIKDLKGTDLIVSTTHDYEKKILPEGEGFRVSFRLTNPLVTGRYLLVAAVEGRQYRDIHYYEYVEGAHYFSSISNERFFGIFQPLIEQNISK